MGFHLRLETSSYQRQSRSAAATLLCSIRDLRFFWLRKKHSGWRLLQGEAELGRKALQLLDGLLPIPTFVEVLAGSLYGAP